MTGSLPNAEEPFDTLCRDLEGIAGREAVKTCVLEL